MAKKKSKTAKQKQSKAKSLTKKRKQISAQYNVPVLNQKKNKNNVGATPIVKKVNGNDLKTPYNSPMTGGGGVSGGAKGMKMMLDKRKLRKAALSSSILKPNANNTETQDFINEYKSLEERTFQQHQQQEHRRRRKKLSSKFTSADGMMNFAKPSFELNQKPTTDEMIIKNTSRLNQVQFMNNGSNQQLSQDNRTLLQRLAAEKQKEERMKAYCNTNDGKQNEEEKMKQNPFWAFQDGDSDDDGDDSNRKAAATFSFAAPSFSVTSNQAHSIGTHANNWNTIVGEDDPDL